MNNPIFWTGRAAFLLVLSSFLFSGISQAEQGELELPPGFSVTVFHSGVGARARHIAVHKNGDVYVRKQNAPGIVALRDADHDGVADQVKRFEDTTGTGIQFQGDTLFFSTRTEIFRAQVGSKELGFASPPEKLISGLPERGSHASKSFSVNAQGELYVNVGAPSNACQKVDRRKGSPGQRPCPLLERFAGVWKFTPNGAKLSFSQDGKRFATGVRNAVAIEWNPFSQSLFTVQHGRDQLASLYPEHYTLKESAELPAEEFHELEQDSDLGWPYTYWDHRVGARMIAPEYGGDGEQKAPEGKYQKPLIGFPGHWAPNDLTFYRGEQFPEEYHQGAFVAFHGSWNRSPFPQQGYRVVFIPMKNGKVSGEWTTFANGFTRRETVQNPAQAAYRPMGLAVGPKGALFITDSQKGRIWKVRYTG